VAVTGRTGKRAPRQADIARLAGVSQATVSVVLGGRQSVRLSATTRQRVLDAADELGYQPDPVATRLASARNNMLGLYTFTATFPTDVAHSYYPILVGIEEQAAALGQDLVLFTGASGGGSRARDEAAIRRTRIADGCLFLGRHVPVGPIGRLMESAFPLVFIGRRDELDGRIPHVGADYVAASAAVVGQLVGLGHRRIRYLRERDDALPSTDRERGVLRGAADAGLPVDDMVVHVGPGESCDELVATWRTEGVTAVVVEETDTGAAFTALTRALERAGLSCPDDLSLAVLGTPPSSGPVPSPVTGFEVPRREMGRRAVELLVELVTADPAVDLPVRQELLACAPRAGGTVGPAG
jgi:DNA-binding LacI/PurR family transcriptional regulator